MYNLEIKSFMVEIDGPVDCTIQWTATARCGPSISVLSLRAGRINESGGL